MKKITGYIYLIIDLLTGKKYVGQHHYHKPELDPNYHGSGRIIKRLYKKRPETLKMEYIKTCYSEEELNEWEKYFIFVFNTLHPNGYNLTEGGEGVVPSDITRKKNSESHKGLCVGKANPFFGKHHSEETLKKISEANKGRTAPNKGKHHSEETRKKISEAVKGRTAPNKGKPMSEEQKRKLSEANKGRTSIFKGQHHSEESRKKMSEAHRGRQCGKDNPFFGKHHSEESRRKMSEVKSGKPMSEETKRKISEKLKGVNNPNYGKPMSEEQKRKLSEAVKGRTSPNKGKPMSEEQKRKLSKSVLQFTLDGEFVREWSSTKECERNGFKSASISTCCNGKRKSHKNFIWLYEDDKHLLKERVDNIKNKRKGENPLKKLPDYSCYGQPLF